ncbi:MAG: ABC transporter ATP-binding protein [Spirochaetota bacterium]|nr:MAG: ABC transporter ATP-binding protein [Spirochaetota bacterium]
MATIKMVDIVKRFGKLEAVSHLDLEIKDREFLVLLGPSGCGKTTTLRSIAGLETIDEGEIWIGDELVNNKRASDRDIAFVFQLYALYPHLTAYKNISFPLETQGMNKKEIEERVKEVANILKINHILKKKPSALSSGDMQRIALGRAMVRRPKAFLMDEPIGTLDAKFREVMRTELKRLHIDIGATTVYVTHDQVEAMSMGDRIAVMHEGVMQQVGKPAEVYDNPKNLFVANFIGSPGMNFLNVTCVKSGNATKAVLASDESVSFQFSEKVYAYCVEKDTKQKGLVLGIRPEWIRIERKRDSNLVQSEIYVVEPLGPSKIIDLKVGNDIIRARTKADFEARIGDKVWIELIESKVHFFDKESGQAYKLGS